MRAHRHVEQRDLGLEDVAEQAGDAQGHVDARPVERGQRQDFDAGDPARGLVPGRLHAEIPQRLREIVAAGAQRGRGPEVDDQRARRLAMILQVAAHDFVGGTHADGRRGAGRDGARIDRGEIAARRQHVGTAARRRAGGTGRHAASVEGGDERRTLAIAAGADGRLSSRRQRERLHRRLVGRAAEDVQAVADAELLDVAELGVELGDGLPVGLALEQPAVGGEPAVPGAFDDLVLEEAEPPAVETVGRGIFLDDAFQLGQRAVQAGGAERRREMADGDGGQTPLGLHRLAGIVDDEGIDHRQRAQHRLGPAVGRQRQRLAGQPFQGAVRAEMDQGVDLLGLAQPGIEREVGMARRAVDVVIARLAIAQRAAIGLQQHEDIAATEHGQAEGIARGRTPGLGQRALQVRRTDSVQPGAIGRHRDLDLIGISLQQALDVGCLPVAPTGVEALGAQQLQDLGGARRRIEADGVARASAARRIVRQDQRQSPVVPRCPAQANPGRRQPRDIVDAIRHRARGARWRIRAAGRSAPRP